MIRGSGRPKSYKTQDGKRVPGTTTITGRFKESGGLIHWAWVQGMEGNDYRKARDDAASAGSIAHDLIEQVIHGLDPSVPEDVAASAGSEIVKRAYSALDNFRKWREQTKLEITHTEIPFVSEKHRFGGTLDAVGTLSGELIIPDWKTSNHVYSDYLCQVAGAYVLLWEEFNLEQIRAVHLLRIDKEFGSFAHHQWGRDIIDQSIEAFLLMRRLYDIDATLKRVV